MFVEFSAPLVFEQHYDFGYDVRIQGRVPLFGFQTFFLRTLTTSHGITR